MKSSLYFLLSLFMLFAACGKSKEEQFSEHFQLGLEYLNQNQPQKAIAEFEQCLKIAPNHFDARFQLAQVYLRQRDYESAVAQLREAITPHPRPLSETERGEYEDSFTKRKEVEARVLLAQILNFQKRFYEASKELQSVLTMDFERISPETRLDIARLLNSPQGMLPNLKVAKELIASVLKQYPHDGFAALQLGIVELELGHMVEAEKAFLSSIENNPQSAEAYYYLGVTYLRQGKSTQAIPAFKRAIDIDPENLEALWLLKLAFSEQEGYPPNLEENLTPGPSPTGRGAGGEGIVGEKPSVRFTNVAPLLGVDKLDAGRGSAWGDYDNDGYIDIFAVGNYAPHALYRNNGPPDYTFTNVAVSREASVNSQQAGVADAQGGWAALFADYDNDGDLDIYITRDGWFGGKPNTLYQNDGNGGFTDVTQESGTGDAGSGFCAAWGDYDNDGYLDLYVANGVVGDDAPNAIYHNNRNGTFTNVAAKVGVAHKGKTIGVAWGDYDKDNNLDLHIVNLDSPNALYHNNGDGTFTDVTQQAGLTTHIKAGFVTFWFDYDNDLDLDLFIANFSAFPVVLQSYIDGKAFSEGEHSVLYRNNNDGRFTEGKLLNEVNRKAKPSVSEANTFTDVTKQAGLYKSFGTMGANFGDIDNDGFWDIYLANGGPSMGQLEPDKLLRNNGDGTFSDVTDWLGIKNLGKGHGVTFGDYNNDGFLDIYVPIGGAFVGDQWKNQLYKNSGNRNNWLALKTVGTKSNRDGIGAKITVKAGKLTLYAEVSGGCGFGSLNSLPVEFGLGRQRKVDYVEIVWPSGKVQKLANVAVNQVLTVRE